MTDAPNDAPEELHIYKRVERLEEEVVRVVTYSAELEEKVNKMIRTNKTMVELMRKYMAKKDTVT